MKKRIVALVMGLVLAFSAFTGAMAGYYGDECFYKIYVTKEATREMKKYKTLKKGDKSSQVRKIKERLSELGYLYCEGSFNKKFDQETKDALLDFQLTNNLTGSDGVAYPYTQYKLFDQFAIPAWGRDYDELSRGDRGWDVENMQKRLMDTGYLEDGTPSCVFDGDTEYAVILFQRENGLEDDGVAYDWLLDMLFSSDMNSYPEQR